MWREDSSGGSGTWLGRLMNAWWMVNRRKYRTIRINEEKIHNIVITNCERVSNCLKFIYYRFHLNKFEICQKVINFSVSAEKLMNLFTDLISNLSQILEGALLHNPLRTALNFVACVCFPSTKSSNQTL